MRFLTFIQANLAAACLLGLFTAPVHAQNIVSNPGFETFSSSTSFPPWTTTASGGLVVQENPNAIFAHSGTHSAEFLANISPGSGTINQTLTTVAGQAYTLDFWMSDANINHNGGTDPFTVLWNSVDLPTLALPNDEAYHEYTFDVTATGTSTVLSFDSPTMFSDPAWEINLDDVSVTGNASLNATPEPGSLALFFTSALSCTAFAARRRRARKAV